MRSALSLASLLLSWNAAEAQTSSAPTQLQVDGREVPVLGVESSFPTLQWAPPAEQLQQVAAQVQVFSLPSGLLSWDSGKVMTAALTLQYSGPTLSSMATYSWQVRGWDANASSPSPYSAPGLFVTGVGAAWTAALPIWHPNASASFTFLRAELPLPESKSAIFSATAFVTANPQPSTAGEVENGKLLAAYRLYVEGAWVGLGPGRPGNCGPICPLQGDPLPCPCSPHHWYDTYNVTALVAAAAAGRGAVTMALQNFNYPSAGHGAQSQTSQVILQVGESGGVGGQDWWRAGRDEASG